MTCIALVNGGDKLHCARLRAQYTTRRKGSKGSSSEFGTDLNLDSEDGDASNDTGTAKVSIVRCPVGACAGKNTCFQNRTGPVCGLCLPGYAKEAEGCSAEACPPESELAPLRITLFSFAGAILVFGYIALAWRPVLPELDWLLARVLHGLVGAISSCVFFGGAQGDTSSAISGLLSLFAPCVGFASWIVRIARRFSTWLRRIQAPQIFKIMVTYFQVLGSFTMFTIQWPDIAITLIVGLKNVFKFEVLQMPGLSCILQNYSSFTQTLYLYTIGPLVFLVALLLPVLAGIARGYIDLSYVRRAGGFPGQGMFTTATTNNEYFHRSATIAANRLNYIHGFYRACH